MNKEKTNIESVEGADKTTSVISTNFAIILGILALFPPFPLHFMGITPLLFHDSGKAVPILEILIWTALVFATYYGYYSILHKQFFPKNDSSIQGKLFLRCSAVLPTVFFLCYLVKLR